MNQNNKYTNFLISFQFFFFYLILVSKKSSASHYQYEACASRSCTHGPNISFPFYIQTHQESYRGFPGFALNCENGFPILTLPGEIHYVVENIFYHNQSLRVYNAAVLNNSSCAIPRIRNTTLDNTRFDYVNETWLHLFSNCTSRLSERYNNIIGCDEGSTAVLYEGDENLKNATEECEGNIVTPVERREDGGSVEGIGEVLRRGVVMSWIASDCSTCESSGGRCGFDATTHHFRCFCTDRPHSRSCKHAESTTCPTSFPCQNLGTLEFPLSNMRPECGLFTVNCTSYPHPRLKLQAGDNYYEVVKKISSHKFVVLDPLLQNISLGKSCFAFMNRSLPTAPSSSFTISPSLTMYTCIINKSHTEVFRNEHFGSYNCSEFTVYYRNSTNNLSDNEIITPEGCQSIQMPIIEPEQQDSNDLFELLSANFTLEWNITEACMRCHESGGQCSTNNMNEFLCKRNSKKNPRNLILAAGISGGGGVLLICLAVYLVIWLRKKRIKNAYLLSRNLSFDPSSKSESEGGSFYYGIPIFCYNELEEATNNFDPSKELGDGGFGTVYHGILKDGREVAIKLLYEHNCKRVQQFMNEIKILTCLKHHNLVNLYGCTSRQSRELLLVYEYIPNGTVADHLHGHRSKEALLTWAVRLNIAIETASALSYLHKSDIVHRDVKTNNILLDSNFCVKVADFGLSRLFPNDVTHISTAPQGTPGYVDPEYHQCYQLTDKSDVYSFGVVLIELISSMPAVDITRHRHEINLANLAVNRIQRREFDELIDSSLGYKTDVEVTRMTTLVAELAFQCLQLEKDMRPSMDEVLDFLRGMKKGAVKMPPSPETDDVELLKNKDLQGSPTGVTDAWIYSGSPITSSTG